MSAQTTSRTRPLTSSCYTLIYLYDKVTNAMITDYTDNNFNEVRLTIQREFEQIDNWPIPELISRECIIAPIS